MANKKDLLKLVESRFKIGRDDIIDNSNNTYTYTKKINEIEKRIKEPFSFNTKIDGLSVRVFRDSKSSYFKVECTEPKYLDLIKKSKEFRNNMDKRLQEFTTSARQLKEEIILNPIDDKLINKIKAFGK